MTTKFRKRALLSSVAMLLIAMLALGSATFAWFSTRQTADASGLSAVTTKADNLAIKEIKTEAWKSSITFTNGKSGGTGYSASLEPVTYNGVTQDDSTNQYPWKKTTAAGTNLGYAGSASTGWENSSMEASSNYTDLYIKYGEATTGDPTQAVYVKVTAPTGANATTLSYVRVALIPLADGTDASAIGNPIVFASVVDDFASSPTTYIAAASGLTVASPATTFGSTVKLGDFVKGTAYRYKVCVYFEGTDPDCVDANAGTAAVSDFVFDFGLTSTL